MKNKYTFDVLQGHVECWDNKTMLEVLWQYFDEQIRIENLMLKHAEVERRFSFHPPKDASVGEQHSNVRGRCKELAHWIIDNVPGGHAQDQAIDKLNEVMMWSNAAIATSESFNNVPPLAEPNA